jgi:hypothetical protein
MSSSFTVKGILERWSAGAVVVGGQEPAAADPRGDQMAASDEVLGRAAPGGRVAAAGERDEPAVRGGAAQVSDVRVG